MKENENFFDKTIARKLITHIILETCHMRCNGTSPVPLVRNLGMIDCVEEN